ncbi:hypothetical protein P8452_30790 [Trifolium repens]|nr:hypothetical protein P8452_30790 [Trifolium repens]
MAGNNASAPRNDDVDPPFMDADGNPMTTVIELNHDLNNPDDNPRVEFETDARDGRKTSISDDEDIVEIPRIVQKNSGSGPNSSGQKAPAADDENSGNQGQQAVTIAPSDFKTLLDALNEHKTLLLGQNQRLQALEKRDRTHAAPRKRARTPPRA